MGKKFFDNMPDADKSALKASLQVQTQSEGDIRYPKLSDAVNGNTLFSYLVLSNNTQLSNTGDTLENVVFTGVITGGLPKDNSSVIIESLVSFTANTNVKTFRVKFNGVLVGFYSQTTSATVAKLSWKIWNRNSKTSQVCMGPTNQSAGWGTSANTTIVNTTIDTSTDIIVTLTVQNAVGTDIASFEAIDFTVNP